MKKLIQLLCLISFSQLGYTQFSFNSKTNVPTAAEKLENNILLRQIQQIKIQSTSAKPLTRKYIDSVINRDIDKVELDYSQKKFSVLLQDTINNSEKEKQVKALVAERDSIIKEKQKLLRQIRYWAKWDRFEEIKQKGRNFFPAYFSSQTMRFFESNTNHLKFFQNNLVNYSPKTQKMTLYTEAVNDYIGPFRIGIGFQVKSDSKVDSLSTADSTKKLLDKQDMIAGIQNGGGDLSINVRWPLVKSKYDNAVVQYLFYFYGNTGFSLPVLNKASDDFLFNYNAGLEGALYAKGFNERLTFYAQFKAAYYNGNKNYKKIITDADKNDPTSFAMLQTSAGIDFLDGYRIRVDLFNGNSFVKKNFPATITFVVRPGKGKDEK
jgi:hypothetical protein